MSTLLAFGHRFREYVPLMPRISNFLVACVQFVAVPALGILVFLMLWSMTAERIDTSLGKFPGPAAVMEQVGNLYAEHKDERAKEADFYLRQDERNAERLAQDPTYDAKIRAYTGKPTFVDQIQTSLVTVLSGFALAALLAVPLGIAIGLNKTLNTAVNPVIQIFKPVCRSSTCARSCCRRPCR
jgi:nitrate/nitrite transport system permease protein